jgi:hypothetical protein
VLEVGEKLEVVDERTAFHTEAPTPRFVENALFSCSHGWLIYLETLPCELTIQ